MERRNFLTKLGAGSLALPLMSFGTEKMITDRKISDRKIIKPKNLSPGDTVGIVSPASAIFETEPYQIAVESLEAMGLKVKLGEHVKNRYGHLAGTDQERAEELNAMFRDREVNGIICLRGGSGAARILELLDYDAIKNNPKVFCGYSDITALHLGVFTKTGLVTFHGPLAVSPWNEFTVDHFKSMLFEGEAAVLKNPEGTGEFLTQVKNRIRTITPGVVKGRLLGGNLSVMTGIMGSEYFPKDWSGKILYLEDVGEAIYAMDRMMTQLELGGVFEKIDGFIFGKCTDCDPGGSGYGSLTLEEVIDHYIKPLGIPAFSGAMIGHIDKNLTIPNGIEAEMNADEGIIRLLSPAVK
ncbi:MAG TPA: LD-carboxypeptidase [Salinimicrobium sp.]|nr:LD-carboxypeptidase [Salinimicrobium sp.]